MMKSMLKGAAAALLGLGVLASGAGADDYPAKPITMIIPLGAGGSHDLNARVITSILPQYVNQPVIVKLMPGASGQTGTAAAAQAQPDGYTLLFTHNYIDQLQQHVNKLPYNPSEDFVTVARTNSASFCLLTYKDAPFSTWDEMKAWDKENPGQLELAHSGQWGAGMVPAALLFHWAKMKVNMTPYSGGGPSMRALLAKDANLTVQLPITILSQGDQVKVIACADDRKEFDVPTFNELGYPGELGLMHRVVLAPSDIPEERLEVLRAAFVKLAEDKTYQSLLKKLGEDNNLMTGPEYEKLRAQQSKDYKELVESMTSG